MKRGFADALSNKRMPPTSMHVVTSVPRELLSDAGALDTSVVSTVTWLPVISLPWQFVQRCLG